MDLGDVLDDGQAKSRAAGAPAAALVHAIKPFEDARQMFRGYAAAGVPYVQDDPARGRFRGDLHGSAGVGVGDGVLAGSLHGGLDHGPQFASGHHRLGRGVIFLFKPREHEQVADNCVKAFGLPRHDL